jgi:adapter protein MecA 1/2
MRIEKISDTQVKFILTNSDLEERNIKMTELAYGSEKTHRLFQEMMRQAHSECNFESDNTPLMVEAMPVGKSHVVIVVTKIAGGMEEEKPLNLIPQAHSNGMFKTHGLHENENAGSAETFALFSFAGMDDAVFASKRLNDCFMGQSRLYKCDGRYFLVIQEDTDASYALYEAETVLHEYGEKHMHSYLSENYLTEHGEMLIDYQSIEKLALYL